MNFSIGDRVRPIDGRDFNSFGEGTIVATYNDEGYYINWDNNNGSTYSNEFRRNGEVHTYATIYMMFRDRIELVSDAVARPPLPSDPRLRGIALKIRELDKKFKRKQEAKAKSIADALAVGAIIEEESQSLSFFTGIPRTIYRDGTISIRPSGHIISGIEAIDNSF
jgi:hypothetical protein